jgi:hypothetical protein
MAENEEPMAKYKSRKRKQSMLPLALGVVGAFAVLAVLATMLSTDEASVYGDVTVRGDGFPAFVDGSPDTAVGLALPSIEGVDFGGDSVTISDDGRPKLILNLAHW